MPDDRENAGRQEETAQDIFRQLSKLIAERLREGREGSAMQPERHADLDEEIKDELRRLREAIRQDEVAHAAGAREAAVAARDIVSEAAVSAGPAGDVPPRDIPQRELSEGLRILFQTTPTPPGAEAPAPWEAEERAAPEPVGQQWAADRVETRLGESAGIPAGAEAREAEAPAGEPTPEAEAPAGEPAPEAEAPAGEPAREAEASPETKTEQSSYFAQFLRGRAQGTAVLTSGLPQLDDLLQGGFEAGLHLISGPPASGGRALLLNLLWKTVSEGRNVRFYCLATGAQRVWEEMIITLSHLMGDAPLLRKDLRAENSAERSDEVARLDAVLVEAFLPFVTLQDRLPASPSPVAAFLRDLEGGSAPSTPPALVLLDSLPQLLATLQIPDSMTAGSLLLELDILLRNRGVPGLLLSEGISASRSRWEQQGLEHLGSGLIVVRRYRGRRKNLGADLEQISLRVLKQPAGMRQGTVPLVLDTASGMLAEAPTTPKAKERYPHG